MRAEKNLKISMMKKEKSVEMGNRKPKRRISSKLKAELVLALLRGESIEELSRSNEVAIHELSSWRDGFLKKGQESFKRANKKGDHQAELERIIGRQQMEIELFKKKSMGLGRGKGNL